MTAPSSQTFRTELWAAGGNNVAIVVPADVVAAFERGKRVPVVVTIDGGYQYRNTIASMGGQLLISFNALFKLNEQGLRSSIVPLIGMSYSF